MRKQTTQTPFEKMGTMAQLKITEMAMDLIFEKFHKYADRLTAVIPDEYALAWELVYNATIQAEQNMNLFFEMALDKEIEK